MGIFISKQCKDLKVIELCNFNGRDVGVEEAADNNAVRHVIATYSDVVMWRAGGGGVSIDGTPNQRVIC